MAVLPILKYPDPRLRRMCLPVTEFDERLEALAGDMKETMISAPGAGLAAPQVDHLLRLIVCDMSLEDEEYASRVLILANPVIVASEGEQSNEEGCLSVIDLNTKVTRCLAVTVEGLDLRGEKITVSAEGRKAVILQHEIDHLDGILFLDRISHLKRDMYRRKLTKSQKLAKNP